MHTITRGILATLAATAALAAGTSTASASEGFNPRNVEWPAAHGALPAQPPYATFANQQDTVRCGVYTIDGQDFIHCLSLVDTMPGHMCAGQGLSLIHI